MNQNRCTLRHEVTGGRETKAQGDSDRVAKGMVDSAWICVAWCLRSSFLRCARNHVVRCSCLLNFRCDTHFGEIFVLCSVCVLLAPCEPLWVRWSRPRMANRERNKKMHAERGNIKMLVQT